MTNTECAAIEINYVHHHHHHNNNNNNNLMIIIIFFISSVYRSKNNLVKLKNGKKKTSGLDSRLACACFVADSLGPAFDS